jgi:hypothetical protein
MNEQQKSDKLKRTAPKVATILASRGKAASGSRMVAAINSLPTNSAAALHDIIVEA